MQRLLKELVTVGKEKNGNAKADRSSYVISGHTTLYTCQTRRRVDTIYYHVKDLSTATGTQAQKDNEHGISSMNVTTRWT